MKKIVNIIMSVTMTITACLSCLAFTGCANRVEVYFDTGTEETFDAVSRKIGDTYGELPKPTREDHAFIGWYTSRLNGELIENSAEVEKSYAHTLYAQWQYIGETGWQSPSFPLGVQEKRLESYGVSHYIDSEGNLFAWGYNKYGRLGDGTAEDRYTPTQIMAGTKFQYISSNSKTTYAIDENGGLWGWGDNGENGLTSAYETGTYYSPEEGMYYSPVKIMQDKKFYKANGYRGLYGFVGLALEQNGNLWVWGENTWGQLGQGVRGGSQGAPVQVMKGTRFIDADTGGDHCAAIDENGNLWVWGFNADGQLGIGRTDISFSYFELGYPTPMIVEPNVRFTKVFLGDDCMYAIDEEGNIWACGDNQNGRLGNGTRYTVFNLTQITKGLKFTSLQADSSQAIALDEYSNLWFIGGVDGDYSWGIGSSWKDSQCVPIEILIDFKVKEFAGDSTVLILNDKGELWTWGENNYGQIGDGTTEPRSIFNPFQVF